MDMEASLVIKVKYGDVLRRFNSRVVGDKLDIGLDGLREKICFLFSFSLETELAITYVDEDGDDVTLVDDLELRDAVKQGLNPLRITVMLKNGTKVGNSVPCDQKTDSAFDISHIRRTLQESTTKPLVKLASESALKCVTSVQGVADVLDSNSKEKTDSTPVIGTAATGDKDGKQSKTHDAALKLKLFRSLKDKSAKGRESLKEPQSEASTEVKSGNVTSVSKTSGGPNIVFSSKKTLNTAEKKPILTAKLQKDVGRMVTMTKMPTFPGSVLFPSVSPSPTASNVVTHHGVQCDYCGVHPITGPRFKSIVKEDYDLCRCCHYKVGNNEDYIKMDYPAPGAYQSLNPFQNGIYNASNYNSAPNLPHARVCGSALKIGGGSKLSSRFVRDVNVVDGTTMAPLTSFTKTWRMRNNGNVVWPKKTQLVWVGGDKLSDGIAFGLDIPEAGIAVDEELDISVDFISPEHPGRYISYWKMASPSDQMFGQRVWVLIQVDASLKEIKNVVRNFNLNSLPAGNDTSGRDINVDDLEPIGNSLSHSNSAVQTAPPVTQPKVEHEKYFPINDSLLVGDGALRSVFSPNPNSVPHPNIGFSNVGAVLSSVSPPPAVVVSPPSCPDRVVFPKIPKLSPDSFVFPKSPAQEIPKDVEMEEKLLRQLQCMGFKNKDLNKEVLWLNRYDMVKTADELCDVEWSTLLKELHEMGFTDKNQNKKLLQKNNGSIKRVVMDLI